MSKLSKAEVNYSLGMMDSHCGKTFKDDKGYCSHFQDKVQTCELVEGKISPVHWCEKFKKAKK